MQETPVGSVFEGLVDGVCMMLILALRRKSAEPPRPFSILDPMTQVLLACAYVVVNMGLELEELSIYGGLHSHKCQLRLGYSCLSHPAGG